MIKVYKTLYVLGAVFFLGAFGTASVSAGTCVDITSNFGYGANDAAFGGQIKLLQTYLKEAGYLSATPNGNFGPGTLDAVKKFQTATGVEATGYVGSLTRLALKVKSCTSVAAVQNTTTQTSTTSATTNTTSTVTPNTTTIMGQVTAPMSEETLYLNSSYTVIWTGEVNPNWSVVLEDSSGVSKGFLSSNLKSGRVSFVWKVGEVYSSATQSNITVAPGRYRVRIQNMVNGISNNDRVSGFFTIAAPPLSVSSITPSYLYNDDTSVAVMIGKGFTTSTMIYIDQLYGPTATRRFLSADGTVIVFSVSPTVSTGEHSLKVINGFGTTVEGGTIRVN